MSKLTEDLLTRILSPVDLVPYEKLIEIASVLQQSGDGEHWAAGEVIRRIAEIAHTIDTGRKQEPKSNDWDEIFTLEQEFGKIGNNVEFLLYGSVYTKTGDTAVKVNVPSAGNIIDMRDGPRTLVKIDPLDKEGD